MQRQSSLLSRCLFVIVTFSSAVTSPAVKQIRCHWCSTVPGSFVFSVSCGHNFSAADTRICTGQSCVWALGKTKDSKPGIVHVGRACSARPVLHAAKNPGADFDCSRLKTSRFEMDVCYCSKEMCNRSRAVIRAEEAREAATATRDEGLTGEQLTQLGNAVDIEGWIAKQASLISVQQFYQPETSGEK